MKSKFLGFPKRCSTRNLKYFRLESTVYFNSFKFPNTWFNYCYPQNAFIDAILVRNYTFQFSDLIRSLWELQL